MALTLQRFQQLQKAVEKSQRDADRLSGTLERIQEQLKEEFQCSSLEAGRKLLAKLEKKEKELTQRFEQELAAFEEKWGEKLK